MLFFMGVKRGRQNPPSGVHPLGKKVSVLHHRNRLMNTPEDDLSLVVYA